jgi:hypothetical protein
MSKSKSRKVVLLAGLSPQELGRCEGIIKNATIRTAHDQQAVLSSIRANPEIAVIHVDHLSKDILQQIADAGFMGKLIPVTNSSKVMRASNIHIAPREVPDAVIRALATIHAVRGQQGQLST